MDCELNPRMEIDPITEGLGWPVHPQGEIEKSRLRRQQDSLIRREREGSLGLQGVLHGSVLDPITIHSHCRDT